MECPEPDKVSVFEKSPWIRRSVAAAALLLAAAAEIFWNPAAGRLCLVPVVFVALYDGWRGGLAAAIAATLALLAVPADSAAGRAIDLLTLFGAGLLTGVLAGRERHMRKQYQALAEQLSTVYEKVQANFEGMKRAERLSAIGQLSAGLAHEIRNPLASISGAADILQRARQLEPKHARCLEIITKECRRLDGLLTNFLNFARPRPPRFQNVELVPVLDNVIGLANHAIRGKTVHLVKRVDPRVPPVECDPEQLEQVLLNLMINAIEASPEGETVYLSAGQNDGKVGIRVIDHGCGVAPADVDRLFDPFFTTKEHGTGLGLSVAHQIVRQMGGALMASRNPEGGMTFAVVLAPKQRRP
ncbi:MAG: hypothetical protein IT158_07220 [Bryobacterales bacterium]|nr:hypothetical protein [Bryobacterales bacterium]